MFTVVVSCLLFLKGSCKAMKRIKRVLVRHNLCLGVLSLWALYASMYMLVPRIVDVVKASSGRYPPFYCNGQPCMCVYVCVCICVYVYGF